MSYRRSSPFHRKRNVASEGRVGIIRFQAAIWRPRSSGQMVDGGLTGSQLGVLKTQSAVHRAFQKDTLTGNREKHCFLIYTDNTTSIISNKFVISNDEFRQFFHPNLLYDHSRISLNLLSILSSKATDNILHLHNTL